MDLSTTYLGLTLRTPLVPSAVPLADDLDHVKSLEDVGASAVVLPSLFAEQLKQERLALHHHLTDSADSFSEARSFFPEPSSHHLGPETYLEHIRRCKETVQIPVIASLNGAEIGDWVHHSKLMQQAGADAIELNLYALAADLDRSGEDIEKEYVEIVRAVRADIQIPLSVKLGPFFTSFPHTAKKLVEAGTNGLVLFNRFFQPDVDLEALDIRPRVALSTSQDLRLPLTWIGILWGRIEADLAATSGVHNHEDVLKLLMAGASVTMLCSSLIKNGITYLREIERNLTFWMERREYRSVREMQGSLSQIHSPDPAAFERAQYMRAIQVMPARFYN